MFYSCATQGNYNDNNLISDPRNILPLQEDEAACVDKGIKSASGEYDFVVVPSFKHRKNGMPQWQKVRNNDVSHFRILVENTIAFLKDFNIIGEKFRVKGEMSDILEKSDVVFHSVAWLQHCFLHPQGIRNVPVRSYTIKG